MEHLLPSVDLHTRGVVRALRTHHYVVSGSNVAELRDAVALLGPRREGRAFGGFTVWALRWTFEARSSGGRFQSSRVTVAVDTVVTLPRWEPGRGVDAATRSEWNRYVLALADHQSGHVAIAQNAASDVAALLRDLQAESPLALHQKGDRMARERIARARAEDAAYDERTRHGGAQGARLGLAIVPNVGVTTSRCA
jgi:predicted secreted Zn-dependent protease